MVLINLGDHDSYLGNNRKQEKQLEHSDCQSLGVGDSNCAHVRAFARVFELVVVVVWEGIKAD